MAKKKKLKLNKKQRIQAVRFGTYAAVALGGFVIGIFTTYLLTRPQQPNNIVWAADNTVQLPNDLKEFLMGTDDCKHYRGTDSPNGVGLWGVYQVSHGKFAKIAYGCSWNLSSYIMAIKQNKTWKLLQPTEYFAPFKDAVDPSKGALPYCTVVETYHIPKDIEPFCIKPDGTAQASTQ